jgi:hypothetical protein
MAEQPNQQFDTIRDAFCAVHRCTPEAFEKKVLWFGLHRHAWLPAHWMWWFERGYFVDDIGAIRHMGDARSEAELQRAGDDLENLRLVERGIRRGTLALRVSSTRAIRLLQPLVPLLKPLPPAPELVRTPANFNTPAGGAFARVGTVAEGGPRNEGTALTVRRLKRLHADVVAGRDWHLALSDSGLDAERVDALLGNHAEGRPELVWLRRYLAEHRELEFLRAENDRLKKAVETLSQRG